MKNKNSLTDIFLKYLIEQDLDNNQNNVNNDEDDDSTEDADWLTAMAAELQLLKAKEAEEKNWSNLPMSQRKQRKKITLPNERIEYGDTEQNDADGHVKFKRDNEGNQIYFDQKNKQYPLSVIRVPKVFRKENLRITLKKTEQTKILTNLSLQNLKSFNRKTELMEDGVAICYELVHVKTDKIVFVFKNYANVGSFPDVKEDEHGKYRFNFIVLTDMNEVRGTFYIDFPQSQEVRGKKIGKTEYALSGKRTVEDELRYAKSRVSQSINYVFKNPTVIQTLNEKFIAEPIGDFRHTEMTSNVIRYMKWGIKSPEISVQYNSVIGEEQLQKVLEKLKNSLQEEGYNIDFISGDNQDLMLDIFGEDKVDNKDETSDEYTNLLMKKNNATYQRRAYAGYIYVNGKWEHKQRVGSVDLFNKYRGLTPIKKLKPKDIQEGKLQVSSMSNLYINGNIRGDQYIVNIKFDTDFAFRPKNKSLGVSYGSIVDPIELRISREIPAELNKDDIRLDESVNEAGVKFLTGPNGVITEALRLLYQDLETKSTNQIVEKITNILTTEDTDNNITRLDENKKPKIKLTESQLIRLRKNLILENLSDIEPSVNNNVNVSNRDLAILLNMGRDWCRNKQNNPDCIELMKLREKLNIV